MLTRVNQCSTELPSCVVNMLEKPLWLLFVCDGVAMVVESMHFSYSMYITKVNKHQTAESQVFVACLLMET